jgi:FAD/FMN-containing dehydrogenase
LVLYLAMSNGNTVGAIPYFLGGGNNLFLATTGYASDNIIAARVVTASGDLMSANSTNNEDLFWALRGAGVHFGLVTSVTVRTYPLSTLESPSGALWSEAFVFPLDRAAEVAEAVKPLMSDATYNTTGLMMAACPPPAFQPALVVSAKLIGDPKDALAAFKVLYDLKPLAKIGGETQIEDLGNTLDRACAKGGFKYYGLMGAREFSPGRFGNTVQLWRKLIATCPDAKGSIFYFEWHSRPTKKPDEESAMSHHDVRFWQGNLLWFEKKESSTSALAIYDQVLQVVREGQPKIDFPNSTRTWPVEWRYRGEGRLARLRAVKQQWDPTGVFTDQFLD